MQQSPHIVLNELRALIAELGTGGGMISPSIYDTAQVLRFCPQPDPEPAVEWLLQAQQRDGAWGDPLIPLARYVPTLASVLALLPYTADPAIHTAVEAGKVWMLGAGKRWPDPMPDDLPVGIELIFPRLLVDAAEIGWSLPKEDYASLMLLGQRRRRAIEQVTPRRGSVLAHSWEGWGRDPDRAMQDQTGSVGHSPAATAVWVYAAASSPSCGMLASPDEPILMQPVRPSIFLV